MIIVRPQEVEESTLLSTNVPLDDYPEYSAGTYAKGDKVLQGIEAYESLIDSNTDTIEEGLIAQPPTWLRLGYSNRWRIFRDGRDSKTSQLDTIEFTVFGVDTTNGIGLLGLEGSEVEITITDPTEGVVYNSTKTITDIGVDDIWEYFFLPYQINPDIVFLDIPPYAGVDVNVAIRAPTETSTAAGGRFVMGLQREIGTTEYGSRIRWLDSSIRERDGFGNITIVPRRRVRVAEYEVAIETTLVDSVNYELDTLANKPTLFVGTEAVGVSSSTLIFGFYRDFDITISGFSISDALIQVEGF